MKILPTPASLEVDETTKGITISYRWYSWVAWFLIFFALLWNGFLVGWFLAPTPWFFKAFASLHLAVGIGLVWYIVALFLNKTSIAISRYEVEVLHQPIPFPTFKNKKLEKRQVQQVYLKENISRGKNGTTITYDICHLDEQGKSGVLLNVKETETGLFIKRKIEHYFGITPQAIEGEFLPFSHR